MNVDTVVSSRNKLSKQFTLIIVRKEDEILLGLKKRGFGVGKWNGFGGKVETGESITNAAVRELQEECGLTAKSLQKHGVLWFENLKYGADFPIHEVHLFTATEYEGEIMESEEMSPKWFKCQDIPYCEMWLSNKYWLPKAINNEQFDAYFLYESETELMNIVMSEY